MYLRNGPHERQKEIEIMRKGGWEGEKAMEIQRSKKLKGNDNSKYSAITKCQALKWVRVCT